MGFYFINCARVNTHLLFFIRFTFYDNKQNKQNIKMYYKNYILYDLKRSGIYPLGGKSQS
jgi:hypothetical protein